MTDKIPQIDDRPNLSPLPEGFEPIKLLTGQKVHAPKIRWGDHFEKGHPDEMPIEWQLDRVKKVASAMNHAADVAQKRVRELIDIANQQKDQIETHKAAYEAQRQTMLVTTTRHNEEQQARMAEMQELRDENQQLRNFILLLFSESSDGCWPDAEDVREVFDGSVEFTKEDKMKIAQMRIKLREGK